MKNLRGQGSLEGGLRGGFSAQILYVSALFWFLNTLSTAGTFRTGKTPETLSERFLEFPREYGWDPPNPIIQGI